jgi:CheY-like chemotaxis protein
MMRIEVCCPKCGHAYLVDESASGEQLFCPGCGAAMRQQPAQQGPVRQQPVQPKPAQRQPARPAATAAAPAASASATAAAQQPEPAKAVEVICPRCSLHFVPGRSTIASARGDRATVLVVEDMEYFREIAVDALASRYEVKTATTAAEARALITAGGIDLMVLDLTLDGGEYGAELLRTMSAKPCPILIFTARDESEMYGDSWDELQELGADDLVMKGMNAGESLLRKTAALLGDELSEED